MKRKLTAVVMAAAMACTLMGCSGNKPAAAEGSKTEGSKNDVSEAGTKSLDKDAKITMLLPTLQSEFFVTVGDSAKAALNEAGFDHVSIESYDADAAKAIECVENCITNQADILAVMTIDDSTNDALKEAKDAGIAIIAAGVEPAVFDYLMLTDNKDAGEKIAEMTADWVKAHFNGSTQIAVVTSTTNANMAERSNAMVDKIKELLPECEIVMNGSVKGTVGEGTQFAENLLQKYPDCQVVATYSDQMSVETAEVFKAAGKAGEHTAIFGNDATQQALKEIADGDIFRGTIDMGEVGKQYAEAIMSWVDGSIEPGSTHIAENIKVTSENIGNYVK